MRRPEGTLIAPVRPAPRPLAHLTARSGWLNDPLAVTWHQGQYHLFFQYVPGRTSWALDCRWGHATSPDLMHWSEQPVALAPGDGDDGVWSGCLVMHPDGEPRVFYTSISAQAMPLGVVRVARPLDSTWNNWAKGAVVVAPADDHDVLVCRDPFVFRDGELWWMLIGASLRDGSAAVLTYSSDDLDTWTSRGTAASRSATTPTPPWTGSLWECPQLLRFPDVDILVASLWHDDELHQVIYNSGHWLDGHFKQGGWRQLTFGDGPYAATSFRDRDGALALAFWIREVGDSSTWAGAISTPYLVTQDGGALQLEPHPNLLTAWPAVSQEAPGETRIGAHVYLRWTAPAGSTLALVDDTGRAVAHLRRTDQSLTVETLNHGSHALPAAGGTMHLIVDGCILEVCSGSAVFTQPLGSSSAIRVDGGSIEYSIPSRSTTGALEAPQSSDLGST